jgi:hypothetical protein
VAYNEATTSFGGGIFRAGGQVTVTNSIFAENITENFLGAIATGGHNHTTDLSELLNGLGDIVDQPLILGLLQDNGGLTRTHALSHPNPAIDTGYDIGAPATDQRGEPRPLDGNGNGTAVVDKGAFEAPPPSPSPTISPTPGPNRVLDWHLYN